MTEYGYAQPRDLTPGARLSQPRQDAVVTRVEPAADDPEFGPQVAVHIEGAADPLVMPATVEGGGVRVLTDTPQQST